MKHRAWRYILTMLSVAFLVVGPEVTPIKDSPAKAQAVERAPAAGTNQTWDSLVAAAKKEGMVVMYSAALTSQVRVALTQAFKAKYGINLEVSPFSRTSELVAKVQAEQRAGLYNVDVYGAGSNGMMQLLKPAGLLGALEPMLILPEVTDGKNWSTGKVPFVDKDKTFMGMTAVPLGGAIYNTTLIKKGEIAYYKDLLKPQYKGKITINDPTTTGAGGDFFLHLTVNIWDLDQARDYLRQLVVQQEAVIERDNRIHTESVARGKYAIGLAPNDSNLSALLDQGAPIDMAFFKEGVRLGYAASVIGMPVKSSHPNAAKLFVNWLLSKEGATVFSKVYGSPSLRNDVPTEGINPIFIRQPGEKIFPESERTLNHMQEVLKMTKQVITEYYK